LIENAIQHGIAPSTRPGSLVIRARRDGDFFEVQVHDNGSGLAVDGSNRRGRVGLANTSDRLQRLYGEHQRFELINDQGLRVNVRLPFSVMPHKGADAA
jgi:sensor histidine kinase YesM